MTLTAILAFRGLRDPIEFDPRRGNYFDRPQLQTAMTHPWHDVIPGEDLPHEFTTVIEIPMGSTVKYELDKPTGLLKLVGGAAVAVVLVATPGFKSGRTLIVDAMQGAMALDVPLLVDVGWGESWGAAK